jgi:hypothetical protein
MKRCFIVPVLASLVLLAATPAGAQISISYAEMQAILVNSTRMSYNGMYSFPVSMNLGTPSASAQNFDFSAIPAPDNGDSFAQAFVDPTGQPGAESFPTATLCTPFVDTTTFPGGELAFVQYYRLQADGFYMLGQYSRSYYPPLLDEEYTEIYAPARLMIPLPLSYGTNRTGVDTVVTDSSNNDYIVRTTTLAVDGWGDLTVPDLGGLASTPKTTLASCLRATETEVEETYTAGSFGFRGKYVSVVYITADGTLLIVEQVDSSYAGGNASVNYLTLSLRTGGATEVRQTSPSVPEGYALSQNYPNPFNPTTLIAFSIPSAGHVRITVHDLLGREVATLVDRQMAPGSYETTFEAAGLPSGLYIYRLVSGSFVETRKMNVVK